MRGAGSRAPVLAALASCLVNRPNQLDPPRSSTPAIERQFYAGTDVRRVETAVLRWSDGRVERHGVERRRDRDGTLRSVHVFEHDRPTGVWRSYYQGGGPRSEVDFGDGVSRAPMRFWHENGQLSGQGLGIDGVKQGPWTFWHPNGRVAAEGTLANANRVGWWKHWSEDGSALPDTWHGDPPSDVRSPDGTSAR